MRRQGAAQGQSLVEFALVLPVLLVILFAFIEMLLVLRAQGTLASVANMAVHQAALAGGETAAVDAQIADLARRNGLDPSLVRVCVMTDGGAGVCHTVDGHNATGGTDGSALYPPPASYNGDITVSLSYAYPLTLPFASMPSWTVDATATEASQMDGGLPAQ